MADVAWPVLASCVRLGSFLFDASQKESIPYMSEWNRVNFDLFDVNAKWNAPCLTDLNRLVVKWAIPDQEMSLLIH